MRRTATFFLFFVLLTLTGSELSAQFKSIYRPDSLSFANVGFFNSRGIVETGIPGREWAMVGAITGQDTAGNNLQSAFLFQMNSLGQPQMFTHYYDTAFFLIQGTRAFDVTYDGSDHFYIAIGTNDNCLVVKTDTLGNMVWSVDGGHHQYESIVMTDSFITFLGQNESFQGGHDYSLGRLDPDGNSPGADMMYGTLGFDTPRNMALLPDGYLMIGQSFNSGFGNMVVKTTPSLEMAWSKVFKSLNKDLYGEDVAVLPNAEGYVMTGRVRTPGDNDSLFIMKLDTSGGTQWLRYYGLDSASQMSANTIVHIPGSNNILVGGSYRGSYFSKSFVLAVDNNGDFVWARDYGSSDTTVEESIHDIKVASSGTHFFAIGDYVQVEPNQLINSIVVYRADVVDGKIPCDTSLLFGSNIGVAFDGDAVFTSPFLDNDPYPLVQVSGNGMEEESICFVMVSAASPHPEVQALRVTNPVEDHLKVFYDTGIESGHLELRDLNGRLIARWDLPVGQGETRIPAPNLAQGIYFLSLQARGEVLGHQKVWFR